MGNTLQPVKSPFRDGLKSYISFYESHVIKNIGKLANEQKLKAVDDDFSRFLEDFIANDETLNMFNEQGKIRYLGTILLMHHETIQLMSNCKGIGSIDKFLEKLENEEELMNIVLNIECSEYLIDFDDNYFKFIDDCPIRCSDSEIELNYLSNFNLEIKINTISSTENLLLLNAARDWIQNTLIECAEIQAKLTNDDLLNHFKNNVLQRSINDRKYLIPCKSKTFNVNTLEWMNKTREDLFSERLDYDPIDKLTNLTRNFIEQFRGPQEQLADSLLRWGCLSRENSPNKTITFVIGPENSGKTTLCNIAHSMYRSFIWHDQNMYKMEDPKLIRTYIIDNNEIPTESIVSSNDAYHLIVTCRTDPMEILTKYGDRDVIKIKLTGSAPYDEQITDLAFELNSETHLGSLLGWCTANSTFTKIPTAIELLQKIQHIYDDSSDEEPDESS